MRRGGLDASRSGGFQAHKALFCEALRERNSDPSLHGRFSFPAEADSPKRIGRRISKAIWLDALEPALLALHTAAQEFVNDIVRRNPMHKANRSAFVVSSCGRLKRRHCI